MNILKILLVFALTQSVYAKYLKTNDKLVVKEDIKFLTVDYQGILNVFEVMEEKVMLRKGYLFTVTDTYTNCDSYLYQGKRIDSCTRRTTLEADRCGIKDTDKYYEQKINTTTHFDLHLENGRCIINVNDKVYGSMFAKANSALVEKDSKLEKYFVRIKN